MALNNWDKRLLKKHLKRYIRLANGTSKPKRKNEYSFVNFITHNTQPRTQHEIAYSKYLTLKQNNKINFDIKTNDTKTIQNFEKNVDYLDEKIILNEQSYKEDNKIAQKISSWYKKAIPEIPNIKLAESLVWINQITSESALSKSLERLSAESFNTLSNAYTKAMDGIFATKEGLLRSGEDHISRIFHRMDLEGHTIVTAIEKVRDALPDDTKWEEFKGLISSLASDMSSVTGLPIATLGKENREYLTDLLSNIGISEKKFVDLWSINTVEVVSSVIPALALLLSWNDKDTKNFTKIVGMINITSIYAGNPISMIFGLVGLARSYHKIKNNNESTKSWILAFSKGGAISVVSIILMSLLGPVIWTMFIVIIITIMIYNKQNRKINWRYLIKFIHEQIKPKYKQKFS